MGDTPLPTDSTPIEVFPDTLSEDDYEAASDRLDSSLSAVQEAFYKYEDDIWTALCDYAVQHKLVSKG